MHAPMRPMIAGIILAFVVSGCSFFSQQSSRTPAALLRYDINKAFADSLFIPSTVCLKVVSLRTGEVLYSRNAALLMRPASNTKLLTTAAALAILGPSYQFRTCVLADSLDETGAEVQNLFLKGSGDPDLSTADIDSLASQIASTGVRHITGDIVADAGFFDLEYWGPGWMWDDEPDPDGAPISALSVNKNCIRITAWPDVLTHRTVQFQVDPPTSYVSVTNCAGISSDTLAPPLRIERLFRGRTNTILIEGTMKPADQPRSMRTTVWQPELYTAQLLREACERRGLTVGGTIRFGSTPASARLLGEFRTPIDSMIVNLNKISDNLSAENTLKTIAAVSFASPGTTASGIVCVNRVLSTFGIDTTKQRFVDGSGLSHYNLVTADAMVRLLQGMYRRTDLFPHYFNSLPIAGRDGTLARRMIGTPAEGNLRAKTGTISGVSSLTGYVRTRDGEMLAFSMFMQNFIASTDRYRDVQDRIGALLASFSRSPQLANP